MTPAQMLMVIVLTAALSSVFTLGLAWIVFERYARRRLELELAELAREAEARIRRTASEAGEDLLPGVREKVREGFEDAIASFVSGSTMDRTAERIARAGVERFESSLGRLFGERRRKP